MDLQIVKGTFSVCKVKELNKDIMDQEFTFVSKSDQELSIICLSENAPSITEKADHGWKCFRIAEDASFEKYGMIAFLANIIAAEKTSTLVVGTFDTDYLFIKEEKFEAVVEALKKNGCRFL